MSYETQYMQWHEPLPNHRSNSNTLTSHNAAAATAATVNSNHNHNNNNNNNNNNNGSLMITPTIKNHSVTCYENHLYCFGGYDGRKNHSSLWIFDLIHKVWFDGDAWVKGTSPPGRNGHTATLATHSGKIIIIGGWLGSGPLAASDMHVLDVSEGVENLRWYQPATFGTPPGPCNMHSADYVPSLREVYVFRGGNGREYLNMLHALNTDTYEWRSVETTGSPPQPRANHSSAILNETEELFIFGGWNGRQRLNDIHILDINTSAWSSPHIGGVVPHARAGMTLTAIRDRLFLFGGSGTSSKCFDDLQVLDRNEMTWLDVSVVTESSKVISNPRHVSMLQHHSSSCYSSGNLTSGNEDWSTVVPHMDHHQSNANPNDEGFVQSIYILGENAPGKRAGHTATAVNNRYLYIFGGSCGSDYLNDFFLLDTDPPPKVNTYSPTTLQLFDRRLRRFFDDEEFSDVTFLVEGQRVYGHKMVLSLVSDCFRAMFTTRNSFKEANLAEIEIPNCSHCAFMLMMEYIYTGQEPRIHIDMENMTEGISRAVELLELADQFILDHLKQVCERILQPAVNPNTCEFLLQVAQKANATQLEKICNYFDRNQDNIIVHS